MSAPERIWAWVWLGRRWAGQWQATECQHDTEYVRADLALSPEDARALEPDDYVLVAVDKSGKPVAMTRFHDEPLDVISETLSEQAAPGLRLRLMTWDQMSAALARPAVQAMGGGDDAG